MRFLCATDLLPKSETAIDRAAMIAERLAADLSLLHVVAPAESERPLEQQLARAIAHTKARSRPPLWRHGTAPNVMVKTGSPSQRIIETIQELEARLIVLGPHRKRGVREPLAGTIVEKVLNARSAPVLIVQREPRDTYRHIVLALDLSRISAAAIRAAESLVLTPEAHATVVHAYVPPYEGMLTYAGVGAETVGAYSVGWTRHADTVVRDFLKLHSADFTRYSVTVEEARPAAAVLRAAKRIHPDLLVMGTHGRGSVRRALLGSVANEVLNAATCDVLIVPDGSMQARQEKSTARRCQDELTHEVIPGA